MTKTTSKAKMKLSVGREAVLDFYSSYTSAMGAGNAALFVGAGFSQPSGSVDWRKLKSQLASILKLDVDTEPDLLALAQYFQDSAEGRRYLLAHGMQSVAVGRATPAENHHLITQLPVQTIWSSGYDTLIEQTYQALEKLIRIIVKPEDFNSERPEGETILCKMLGDINDYNNVVLTKADHELYDEKRRAFTEQFKSDLLSKTFLFLGVSFDDPYFNYILSRIPMLLAGEKRVHYCVMKKPDSAKLGRTAKSEYDAYKRFMLCVKDLRRYSIETLLVEDYAEVTEILCELNRRQYFKNISISGNVPQGARSEDQSRIESLAYGIGREVIKRGYHLFSSTESRIDTNALLGAVEEAYRSDGLSALQRIHLPTTAPRQRTARIEEAAITAQPRQLGMMNSGFVIFLGGDLTTTGGQSIPGAQTGQPSILEDYEIAKLMGIYPLPVGFTGSAAKQIWGEVNKSLRKFYVIQRVANHFAVLKDTKRSNAEIIEAIFTIIENTISSV